MKIVKDVFGGIGLVIIVLGCLILDTPLGPILGIGLSMWALLS